MPCAFTLLDARVRLSGLSAFGSIRIQSGTRRIRRQFSVQLAFQMVLADDEIVPACGLAGPPTVAHCPSLRRAFSAYTQAGLPPGALRPQPGDRTPAPPAIAVAHDFITSHRRFSARAPETQSCCPPACSVRITMATAVGHAKPSRPAWFVAFQHAWALRGGESSRSRLGVRPRTRSGFFTVIR